MMRKTMIGILLSSAILLNVGSAKAVTLGFDPLAQSVSMGTPVDVAVTISGLGSFTPPSVGTFDLTVAFDPSILSFKSVSYGDPNLGDQLDLFGLGSLTSTTPGVGDVGLFELSFDLPSDLDSLQPGSFSLAVLTFDTIGLGTSSLGLQVNALGDAYGDPLSVESILQGSVQVVPKPVPEPGTLLLLGSGLAGLGLWGRKKFKGIKD